MTDTFKKKQLEFFDSRTPEDPAYWSTEIFDIYDENYDKVISKRGQAELKRLEAMEWQDVIREYVRWWIKGMSMLHVVSSYFNTGNSSPYQYGWYPHGFANVALKKLLNKCKARIKLEDQKDKLDIRYSDIEVTRDLGFGKNVERGICIDLDFNLVSSGKKLCPTFKPKVSCYGQPGFYDNLVKIADDIRAELVQLKADPIFKTNLKEYDTYPDVSQYKDKHDQLGIINAHSRWDTLGRGVHTKFNPNYIAAYKEALEYCPGVPHVEYSDDLKTCVYKGETFTAQEVDDICCKKVPDSLHFITQGISEVLYHKYGLLPTLLEDQFSPEDIIKTHVHWIHDNYNMPIDKELQALIDKYHVTLREPTVFK